MPDEGEAAQPIEGKHGLTRIIPARPKPAVENTYEDGWYRSNHTKQCVSEFN
jgi:hypothetical protein